MGVYTEAGVVSAGEPMAVDPETAQEMARIAEDKLELLGQSLAKTREKWVAARGVAGVEKRWMEDLDQYNSKDIATQAAALMMDAVEQGGFALRKNDAKVQRSTVFVNITRPKTNAVEARLANMLYPADDLAWGIKPTPNPKLAMQAMQEAQQMAQQAQAHAGAAAAVPQGQQSMAQPTPAQVPGVAGGIQPAAAAQGPAQAAQANPDMASAVNLTFPKTDAQMQINTANIAAKAMQQEILDALTECDFNAEARKMLHDVAVLGTGVMKGPIVVNRVAKAWEKVPGTDTHVLKIVQEIKPASECVSPWHVYPDPSCGDDIHNGKGIFEKRNYTAKQLRELVGQPGFLEDQIALVLEQGPRRSTTMNERDRRDKESRGDEPMFECWEYWGEFSPDDLRACGVDVKDGSVKVISGCVVMVNDIVIKGFINPLECGSMPYDFMVLEKGDNSPWGYGVPFLCRPAQRVLTAAWRQMMDNAGLSVGPNVILKPNIVQPADGVWQVTGRKIWNCTDDSVDVQEAMHVFEMPNNTDMFEKIINLALMFADEESSVPKISQGDAKNSPDSVGGMTIQMNSANVVLGRLVKQYDDMITKRHIRRYYDFMMAYSEKADIKGDYQVDARGSTVLLVRDQQLQALLQFGQFQGSAIVSPMVRWHMWLKEILKAQNLNPADILKSDDEIEQILNAPPGPSPEQLKSDSAKEVAQIRAQSAMDIAKAKQQGEQAYADTQAQMARDNHIARIKELELERELQILKYANEQKQTLDKVKADLAKTSMIEETKRQVKAADLQAQANEGDKNRLHETQTAGVSNA